MARSPLSQADDARTPLSGLPYTPQGFASQGVRGWAHPQLVPFLRATPHIALLPPEAIGRVYREHPNLVCEVIPPEPLGLPWPRLLAKSFGWRGFQHYVASPLKRSRALKAARTACHLLAHGLATPLPLAVYEARRWGFVQSNVYITAVVPDAVTLEDYYATLPEGATGFEAVLRLVATYTRQMHDSGLWHRDLVRSNVLLSGPPGQRQISVVDLNRARRLPWLPVLLRAMDLARLGWPAHWPHFCALYSGQGVSAQRLLWCIRLYSTWRTWRWHLRRVVKPLRAWLRL